jgi:hypothetical protein
VVANPVGADNNPDGCCQATRRRLLDRVIADKSMICGYHFPFAPAPSRTAPVMHDRQQGVREVIMRAKP